MHTPKVPPPRVAIHGNLFNLDTTLRGNSTAEVQKKGSARIPFCPAGMYPPKAPPIIEIPENTAPRSWKIELRKHIKQNSVRSPSLHADLHVPKAPPLILHYTITGSLAFCFFVFSRIWRVNPPPARAAFVAFVFPPTDTMPNRLCCGRRAVRRLCLISCRRWRCWGMCRGRGA